MSIYIGAKADGTRFELEKNSLCRHVVVLGATGCGKTVLCKAIVEEVALEGIPVLALDPKGDVSALAISSPNLYFRPWSDIEALTSGKDPESYAEELKRRYEVELRKWNIGRDTIVKFHDDVEVLIFTPGDSSGLPLSIAPSLEPPPNVKSLLNENPPLVYDALNNIASILLSLAGYSGKKLKEHTILTYILERFWVDNRSPTLEDVVRELINPSFDTIGSLKLDEFMTKKERLDLARNLNVLLTNPAYKTWLTGERIDFDRMLSRGRIIVVDLRFLGTLKEKQLFVSLLLQELYRWLLRKGGLSSLRLLLYFDELLGFIPPVGAPPSKNSLMLLVKQGRAFGLGCLLATQNPSDIDYRILSNATHRFIGRLTTKQDVEKVRNGLNLEASIVSLVSKLKKGTFLYHNYELGYTEVVRVRWLITYHRGPLQPEEIKKLMKAHKPVAIASPPQKPSPSDVIKEQVMTEDTRKALLIEPRFKETELKELYSPLITSLKIKPLFERVTLYELDMELEAKYDEKEYRRALQKRFIIIQGVLKEVHETSAMEAIPMEAMIKDSRERLSRTDLERHIRLRLHYSPLLGKFALEDEVKTLKEEVNQHLRDNLERELHVLDVDYKLKEKELLEERPILVAELKIREADLKEQRSRLKRLEELREEMRRRRISTASISKELLRLRRRVAKLEGQVSALKKKLEMLSDELKSLKESYEKKRQLIYEKYEAMRKASIVTIDVTPTIKSLRTCDAYLVRYMVAGRYGKAQVRFIVDPYEGEAYYGKCSICNCELIGFLDDTPQKLPYCVICGAPLCTIHSERCVTCLGTLCREHILRCSVCGESICEDHSLKCTSCGAILCAEHVRICRSCGATLCNAHALRCEECGATLCSRCVIYKRRFFRKKALCSRCALS